VQLLEDRTPGAAGVFRARRIDGEEHDSIGPEADVDGADVPQRAHEQAGADQKNNRHAHLQDHQRPSAPRLAGAGRDAAAVLERRADVATHRLPDRRQAEQHTRRHSHAGGEDEDADVEDRVELLAEHPRRPKQMRDRVADHVAKRKPQHSPAHAQREALGEQLASEASASRAQRQPQRQFAASRLRPRQQQRRHVGARDEQDQSDQRAEQQQRCREFLARVVLAARAGQEPEVRPIAVGSIWQRRLHHLLQRRIQRRLRFDVAHPRPEPAHDLQPPVVGIVEERSVVAVAKRQHDGLLLERHEQIRALAGLDAVEPRRVHADDGDGDLVDADLSADDRRLAAETARPQAVADDGHGLRAAACVVLRHDRPADCRRDADGGEEIPRHQLRRDQLRLAVHDGGDAADRFEREHRIEGGRRPLKDLGTPDAKTTCWRGSPAPSGSSCPRRIHDRARPGDPRVQGATDPVPRRGWPSTAPLPPG
jgi:hypothetical protein